MMMMRQVFYGNGVNLLTGTLKPRSNGPLYSNTVIGSLAVDGWAVIFRTAKRGVGRVHQLLV